MLRFIKTITLPFLIFLGFFLLYVHNLSRGIYGGDVGDVVTASATFGVAHPPGYPLFTLLGFFLTKLPLHESPAFLVGLISVGSGSLGVLFFYLLVKRLTKNTLVAILASCILGFSFLYWFYAEIAEVFELNVFFAILLFYLAIVFRDTRKKIILFLLCLVGGLSMTHHQTIILIFPSLLLLTAQPLLSLMKKSPLTIFFALGFLLLGLTPFAYIFIASSTHPLINWDHVKDIPSFFHLILRRDYGTFQAGIFDTPSLIQRLITVQVYAEYLLFQLTIPTVFLICLGFFHLFKKDKILFSSILLAWILSGPVFLAYAGFPLTSSFIIGAYERFTLLSTAIFLLPAGSGLVSFSEYLARFLPKRHYPTLFQSIFFFIPLMLCLYNFPKTNLATTNLGNTYAQDFLTPLPSHAILLTSGDTEIFNTWYVHDVLHMRPDVLVYNIGAVPVENNSIAASLEGVPAKKMMEKLFVTLESMQKQRPVFSLTTFQPKTGPTLYWMPYGLTYKLFTDPTQLPTQDEFRQITTSIWSRLTIPTPTLMQNPVNHNLTIAEIPDHYGDSLVAAGTYAYTKYQDYPTALSLYQKAVAVDPENPRTLAALGILYTANGKCNQTVAYLSQSLLLNPYQDMAYFILYNTYQTCLHDKTKAQAVSRTYQSLFQKDFMKDFKKAQASLTLPSSK